MERVQKRQATGIVGLEGCFMRAFLIRVSLLLLTLAAAGCRGDIGNLFDIY